MLHVSALRGQPVERSQLGMEFETALIEGRLIRRYKRFLADVELVSGETVTAHCPNTGAMAGCAEPGFLVWLAHVPGGGRKYAYRWELVETAAGYLVGINTARPNRLVEEALAAGLLPEFAGYGELRREVTLPDKGMRVDMRLRYPDRPDLALEVKNVTAAVENGEAYFPDAVTVRGRKHLNVLADLARNGQPAALVYCVQRADVTAVRPAAMIDPAYADAFRAAIDAGVTAIALRAEVSPQAVTLTTRIPVVVGK